MCTKICRRYGYKLHTDAPAPRTTMNVTRDDDAWPTDETACYAELNPK